MSVSFQLPSGPKQLAPMFAISFDNMEEYFLELVAGDTTILTTPRFKRGCCCTDDNVRIFFLNTLGGIDAINFRILTEETETNSESWKKPLKWPLGKFDGGKQRFNVVSNESVTAENKCYQEDSQEYLKELYGTPNAWIQWIGTQGQNDDYIPIVIKDGKFTTRKNEGRYEYVNVIEFEFANENQVLRN